MAARYTYDDFYNAANSAGMLGQFSQYDLDLAQAHPEAGLSLLTLKQDYAKAGTDEQRALINEAANQIRSSYGNYTAGTDGLGYVSTGKLHRQVDDTLDQLGSFGSFSYGRENDYQRALDDVVNREAFSWDKDTDPSWQAYKKQYTREGRRATEDTLGQYAAMTGGMPSSAAVTAATQAGDYYAAQMSDKIPELYQQAYNRYLQEYQQKQAALSALASDRQRAYGEYTDQYDMLRNRLGDLQGQENTEYTRAVEEALRRQEAERYAEEQRIAEEQRAQQAAQQALENQMALAKLGYGVGDYAGLNALGITPNNENIYAAALAEAGRLTPVGSGGSGGGGGSERDYSSIYETMFANGLTTQGDAYAWLLEKGYNTTQAKALAGYFAEWMQGRNAGGAATFGASEDIYDDYAAPQQAAQGQQITGRDLAMQYALEQLGKNGLAAAQTTLAEAMKAKLITQAEMSELQIEIARRALKS